MTYPTVKQKVISAHIRIKKQKKFKQKRRNDIANVMT